METVTLLYEDYQKELAEDFKNTFLKRASDTDSSRSNDAVIDEVTDMLSTNIAVYTEKLLRQWGFSSGGEGGSGGGDVTVTLDDLLQKYLEDNYVTIKGDQEVYGEKDFRKGIRIAGRRLYWDESNDALVIEGAAYTTRWLSAYGMSPGGGGAGSGGAAAMYQLIDVSPNDTKDAVLGAEKDYVLTFDGNFWRGMPNKGGLSSKLFTALDKDGNEVNPDDENSEIYAIRANYSLWSVGFLSAKGISDGGTGGGGGGAVALYQLLDVEKNSDITGVAGATKGSVLTFNGDKWYADKPKTAEGINRLFSALDSDGNEVDLNDESKLGTITNIRANYALWSVDWISAKGKSSGGSGGGGGLISLVYGFESLGGTFDNNDNTATFNAFTINEIWKLASSGLTNVTVTGSGNAVTDVTKGSDGRSLTFTKGNTFASKSEFDALNTKFNDFLTGSDADDIINKWSELEVFLQGMKESDNLAVILQSKMDKSAFNKLFSALDSDGNEIDPSDDTKTVAAIRANFGFWGVDYVSAKGVSKGSGGTGGASALYQLVDVLANDAGDGVDGAAAGKALVFDGTHWKAADAGLNESQLSAFLSLNGYLTQTAADGRYVNVTGDTMTGDLTMNNTKGFNIGWSTRVVKTSGVWIHGGADAASSTDANLRFGSWYGIGWYPTFSGGSVAQGNNAMWLNVRNGNLDTHGAITAHTNFLAANWDSARRLVMGGGSTYAWIDSRNSSNNVLCNIVLQDNKVTIGNYAESSRFVSTVGTGTQPYQCSSTTLNTNLNADLLDGFHTVGQSTNSIIKYGNSVGGTTAAWSRIAKYSIPNTDTMCDVCFILHSSYNNSFALLNIRARGTGYIYGQLISSYNIDPSKIRIYHSSDKKEIELYYYGGENYSIINAQLLYSTNRDGLFNSNVTMYRSNTTAPSWSTYVGVSTVTLQNNAESATKLATSRNIWGKPFNGTADIIGDMTNVTSINGTSDRFRIGRNISDGGNLPWYGISFVATSSEPVTMSGYFGLKLRTHLGILRILENGNIGIGTDSPSQNLHIVGNAIATGAITAKSSSSDIRLKTDIQGYDAMGIIRKFRSVKYHWNAIAKENSEVFNHDNWNYGLIAQDLLSGGYSQWVKDAFNDYYTIDYERLIPVVWKGLQEVDDEVTKLRKEVVRLNKRISELEKFLCA